MDGLVSRPRRLGNYLLFKPIASGGMGSVYLARSVHDSRPVAIKSLHPHLCRNADFVAMLRDEARLVRCIRHPNVVQMLELGDDQGEVFLVMEYVHGEAASALYRKFPNGRPPPAVASAIVIDVLQGLSAAHQAVGEDGKPLGLIHRDVSPQNVIVGIDGVARILDFGIAKATGRMHETRDGAVKGKLPYMPPEMLRGASMNQSVDTYAAGVVLWELLTGERLFHAETDVVVIGRVMEHIVVPPSKAGATVSNAVDEVVLRAIARKAESRFQTAQEFADALRYACPPAAPAACAAWLASGAAARLAELSTIAADMATDSMRTAHDGGLHFPDYSAEDAAASMGPMSSTAHHTPIPPRKPKAIWPAVVGIAAIATTIAAGAYFARGQLGATLPTSAGAPGTETAGAASAAATAGAPSAGAAGAASPAASSGVANVDAVRVGDAGARSPSAAHATAPEASGSGHHRAPHSPRNDAVAQHKALPTPVVTAHAPPPASAKVRDPSSCYETDSTGTIHIRPECR